MKKRFVRDNIFNSTWITARLDLRVCTLTVVTHGNTPCRGMFTAEDLGHFSRKGANVSQPSLLLYSEACFIQMNI